MRRLLLLSVFLLPALFLAGPAAALNFEEVIFTGDCLGWTAELVIHLQSEMTEADFSYEVSLADSEGMVILSTSGAALIPDEDGDRYCNLVLSGTWDELTEEIIELYGLFSIEGTFTLYSPRIHPIVRQTPLTVECAVVPSDDSTWGEFKSQYR